jgi:hypothetical protein
LTLPGPETWQGFLPLGPPTYFQTQLDDDGHAASSLVTTYGAQWQEMDACRSGPGVPA